MVEIRPVRTRSELKAFVAFPERLYHDHPYYVPKVRSDELKTLRADRNPAFEYCEAQYWMAFRDGEPVGRIAGILSRRYIETWRARRARFGWLDFVDDPEVSRALLGTVEAWAREKGLDAVHGPLGFCDLDREGMLVEGFDEMDLMITNYNFPYYPAHLEALGYVKDVDWVELQMKVPDAMPESVDRVSRVVLERAKLHLVPLRRMRDARPYVAGVFRLVNEAYQDLYSVVALSDRQIEYYAKTFFAILDPRFVKIMVDREDRVVAFGVAMPSLSRALQKCRGKLLPFGFIHILHALRTSDRLDLLLTAVKPEYRNKGIPAVLISEMWKSAVARHMKLADTGPELETNDKVRAMWKQLEPRQHRRRRCFVKDLAANR